MSGVVGNKGLKVKDQIMSLHMKNSALEGKEVYCLGHRGAKFWTTDVNGRTSIDFSGARISL